MKKIFCLILTLVLVVSIGSFCFATEGDTKGDTKDDATVTDSAVPGAPARTVDNGTYAELEDELPAGGSTITDEVVPKGDALPKTGGIPAEAFYVAGLLIIVAALIVSRKKPAPKS